MTHYKNVRKEIAIFVVKNGFILRAVDTNEAFVFEDFRDVVNAVYRICYGVEDESFSVVGCDKIYQEGDH